MNSLADEFWSPSLSQTVWLFGHTGYVGRHLSVRLRAEGHEVIGISSAECDLTDADAVRALIGDDLGGVTVVMAAAIPRKKGDTEAHYHKNMAMAQNVMDAIMATFHPPESIILFSSADVYGPSGTTILNEDSALRPDGLYALYKTEAEKLYREACRGRGIPLAILRPPGIHGGIEDDQSLFATFESILAKGGEVTVTNSGLTLRSFLRMELLEELICVLVATEFNGTINVADLIPTSTREIATACHARTGSGTVVFERTKSDRDYHLILDVTRMHQLLGVGLLP